MDKKRLTDQEKLDAWRATRKPLPKPDRKGKAKKNDGTKPARKEG